ncbi:MAG: rod shape-determining protein MreC [Cyanothece sp. SIO1E1]|nr:rod shape-determining protein MreC [Cyanothece sp. SIO1E1]
MYTLRRWWDRYGLNIGVTCGVIGITWFVYQTEGTAIYELYQLVTRPFQTNLTQTDKVEDARTLELQQRLLELESQNQQLQKLVGQLPAASASKIVAPVIGRSADNWWQQVILGRGSRHGVKIGDIVTAPGGLVGRIVRVTPNTSRTLLISDPASRVGVVISRSRNMGYIRGRADNQVVMEFFDKTPDVRQGDVVATSSVSQLFPAGLSIGRIQSVNLNKSPAPEAIIELSAPINALEWAIIQPNPSKL